MADTQGEAESGRRQRAGTIERSVRAFVRGLPKLDGPQATLREMALRLARSYDAYDGGDLAKLARLNMELRQTLVAIAEASKHDEGEPSQLGTPEWSEVPAPVRDAAQPGAADAGRPDRGGGPQAG